MGLGIIVDADFSANAIGNTDQVKDYFIKAGITNNTYKSAITTLVNNLKSAGLWSKIDGLALFHGDTYIKQRWYMTSAGNEKMTFFGSPTFSPTLGYKPDVGAYAITKFTLPDGNINNFSIGVYTTSARAYSAIMGVLSSVDESPSDYILNLMPSTTVGRVQGAICKKSSPAYVFTSTTNHPSASASRGFLQFIRNNNVETLLDDTTTIASGSISTAPIGGGTQKLILGAGYDTNDFTVLKYCNTQIALQYWGRLTETEAVTFRGYIETYMNAIGR